ncbi:MAG: LLM class flavin-dependent oxidoreductase [Acidobacteriota bacterium]
MRFSLRLNNDLRVEEYVALAREAEAAGFDQLWVSHDLFLRSAPVLVARMLEETESLHVGIGILNPYTQHPGEIAMLASTFDEAYDGRFLLGIAAGARDFLSWVGLEQRKPLGAVREAVATVRALQAGERSPEGELFHGDERAYLRFPAPRRTPIYVGAMGPKMLELTGEVADGALPLLFPPELYTDVRKLIETGGARRDESLPPIDLAACFWVSIDDDAAAARHCLALKIAYYGHALGPLILDRLGLEASDFDEIRRIAHDEDDLERAAGLVDDRMLAMGVAGTPESFCERLRPLVAAGARHLSFGPPLGPDPIAAVRRMGGGVVDVLKSEFSGDAGGDP